MSAISRGIVSAVLLAARRLTSRSVNLQGYAPLLRALYVQGLAALCLLACIGEAAAQLPAPLAAALEEARIPENAVAVWVQDPAETTPLLALNGDRPMNPASVIKLVTTFTALEALTPAYRWHTEIYGDRPPIDGRLRGNLYIKGYGDPRITLETLWLWLRELRGRGLREVDGDLVLDRSFFDLAPDDPGAFDGQPLKPYNAGPDALLIDFRSRRLTVLPQGDTLRLALDVDAPGVKLVNRLTPVAGPCGDWENGLATRVERGRGRITVSIEGPYPLACGEQAWHLALFDGNTQWETLFRALWSELGGRWRGKVTEGTVPGAAHLIARFESPPLTEVVRDINKFSNNVMARQLYLSLGAELLGPPATLKKAEQASLAVLASRGLDFLELALGNGSGLDRSTRISARHLALLLERAQRSLWYPEFAASLPLVGLDGTLRRRHVGEPLAGQARLKSGSLHDVRALAGYLRTAAGRDVIVVCLVNYPDAARARPFQDALLRWVFETR
ncbi:D-alanyl-D-alanine carboxypeptidase/D-alanyl-D-alanine endopeptidase [Thiobacter aerophilum]|uniref:D-alanyl-D-alanine carboxypeptidase/D-alanyl-D-alanine-endopeptidase n=1 Tax=Thiobacter aerophilum TaxID=3121275 RepID=A0ABV0EJF0_9BURK